MNDPTYPMPAKPVYNPELRMLQDDDPASATETFNPLIQQMIQNTHAVKQMADAHHTDAMAHVTEAERAKWNDAAMGIMAGKTGPVAQIMAPLSLVGYGMDVTARAVAVQAGTGTPSPANVRPITGRNTLTITRCGKNLMTQPYTAATGLGNGVEFTRNADGSITANGTATKDIYYGIRYLEDAHITLLPGVTYLMSSGVDRADAYLYFETVGSAATVSINGGLFVNNIGLRVSPTRVTVSKPTNIYCRLYIKTGTTLTNFTLYPMIELSPVDTAYEPYTGNAYVYTFADKVYGLPNKPDELLSAYGKLLRRTVCQSFTGAEDWAEAPEASNASTKVYTLKCATLPPEVSRNTNLLSSHFAPEDILQSTVTEGCVFSDNGDRLYVRVLATRCADLSAWKAYLAAQSDGGTPWQVVYERRAFLTETVPIKPITALQGLNNLYSDAGGETAVAVNPYA